MHSTAAVQLATAARQSPKDCNQHPIYICNTSCIPQPLCTFISRCSLQHLQGQGKKCSLLPLFCLLENSILRLRVIVFAACAAWLGSSLGASLGAIPMVATDHPVPALPS